MVLVTGCNGQEANEPSQENNIAIVNGEGISKDDYQIQLSELKEMVQMQYDIDVNEDEDLLAELENQALENLINKTLLLQEIEKQNIRISQEEIDENIDQIKSRFEDEAQFEEALATDGLEINELEELIREDMLLQKILAEVEVGDPVSEEEILDEEIREFYEQQKLMTEGQGAEFPPLEEIEPQIVDAIMQQKQQLAQQQAIEKFITDLREKSDIEVLL